MLWFVIAVVIFICLLRWFPFKSLNTFALVSVIIILVVGIIIPLLFDLGYNERKLERTIELVSFGTDVVSEGNGNMMYISVSHKKIYTYRYEVKNTTDLEGTMYKTDTVSGNVEEIESAECKTPMLYVYVEKTKNSWWYSCNTENRYTYVFYVPEGTIVKGTTPD